MSRKVRENDDLLAFALARGDTIRDAAAYADISEKTASRRWANPEFRQRVNQLRGELVNQAAGKLSDAMTAATDKLLSLLNEGPPAVALGAARTIIEQGIRVRESTEFEQRLNALEESMNRGDDEKPQTGQA